MYCLFCHNAVKFRKVCPTCRSGFVKWILKHTNIRVELAVHKAIANLPFCLDALPKSKIKRWPGFYVGDGSWIKPEIYFVTDEDVKWENAGIVLSNLLLKNKIDLRTDIQIHTSNIRQQ